MKKSKKLAGTRSLRRRRMRSSRLDSLEPRIVLSGAPPIAANDMFAVQQDTPLAITAPGLLANDTDAEGDALSTSLFGGPAHGTLALQADGSFSYTPDAGFTGVDSFLYQDDDGTSKSALAAVSLDVIASDAAPTIALDPDSSTAPGTDFATTFTEGGGPVALADSDAALADASASNLTSLTATIANSKDGSLESLSADTSGTAITASYDSGSGVLTLYGSDSVANYLQVLKTVSYDNASQHPDTTDRTITFVANDGAQESNVATTTLSVVGVNNPPVAANDSYSTDENAPLVVSTGGVLANDTDAAGNPLTASLVAGPQHGTLTLNPDGTFTYTPAANFSGTDGFSYQANDGSADSNVAAVTIAVNPVATPPNAMNDHYSVAENAPLSTDAASGVLRNDTDATGDPLSASLVEGPAHGILTLNADGSFDYTPDANFSGTDGFTYVANDGGVASSVAAATITVDPVNTPPASVNDSYSATADTPLNVDAASGVLANDTDVDGDALTANLVAGPQHGSLTLNADGSFSYTPAAGYMGADQFTYQAFDGQADGNVATVSIVVAAKVNQPPVAADDAYSVTANQTLNVPAAGVLANDTDAEGDPLTAAMVDAPQHGTLTLNADGSFSYTPAAGYVGADSFTYHANDGTSDSNLATVSISVNAAVNHRPVAANDVYSTQQDSPLNVSSSGVLANDTDPDGDPLTATLFEGPQHGTLTLNADGSFAYTPDSGYTGDDSFSYQASDGQLDSELAAVTIHVVPGSGSAAPLASGVASTTSDLSLSNLQWSPLVSAGLSRWNAAASRAVELLGLVTASVGDLDPTAYPQDLTSAESSMGVRKLPSAKDVDAIFGGLA